MGWHFPKATFTASNFPLSLDVFVLSHAPINRVPKYVFDMVGAERILARPNIGYDWGAYQQFIESIDIDEYEYAFFMHDDVVINSSRIFSDASALLEKCEIVGLRSQGIHDWASVITPAMFAHMSNPPAVGCTRFPVVRGSFFATRPKVIKAVRPIQVFWDRFQIDIGYGNHSLVAFCSSVDSAFGHAAFAWLADHMDDVPMHEMVRGGNSTASAREQFD